MSLHYDNEQEEELFEAFDKDKDYFISDFEEFRAKILNKKQADVSFLIKINSTSCRACSVFEYYSPNQGKAMSFYLFAFGFRGSVSACESDEICNEK